LLAAVEEIDLIILNGGTPTLLHPSPNAVSVIDLVIASPQLAPLCLGAQVCLKSRFCYKILLSKEQFQSYFRSLLSNVSSLSFRNHENVIALYDSFVNDILMEARDFFPERKRFPRTVALCAKYDVPPLWNKECSEAVGGRRKAIRLFISCPTPENFAEVGQIQ
ncbi:hypothetical protein ALC57_17833, partial [Trachymyrmex cornetzi]